MSGETKRAERTGTNEQRDKAGGTAERMDKRTVGRADRADRTDGQEAKQPNEWTNGRMDERTEQDRTGQNRTEQTEQDEQAEKRSRQAKQTDCRHLAPPFGRFAKHRTESCRRRKKRQSAPEKPDGSGNREQKPGADRTEVETGSRSDGSGSDGSGSAKKTIRNQRTIISVCPSALTLCDARQ